MSAVVTDRGTVQAVTSLAMAPKPRLNFLTTAYHCDPQARGDWRPRVSWRTGGRLWPDPISSRWRKSRLCRCERLPPRVREGNGAGAGRIPTPLPGRPL